MVIGIILKGCNAIHEKEYSEFIFIFLPQLIMMLIMFGYMDFLIFVKWNTTYECNFLAPDIKGYLMNIFLKFGEIPSFGNITTVEVKDQDCQDYLYIKKGTGKLDWILLADRPILEKIHITIFVLFILLIVIM